MNECILLYVCTALTFYLLALVDRKNLIGTISKSGKRLFLTPRGPKGWELNFFQKFGVESDLKGCCAQGKPRKF